MADTINSSIHLGRCAACRCDLCPAYRGNLSRYPDRAHISTGWRLYFGLDIPPEWLVCDGCRSGAPLMAAICPIRPCVLSQGIDTCDECALKPCDKITSFQRFIWSISEKHPDMSEEDKATFLAPFWGEGTK
jgi:hypothetical protein